MDDNSGKKATDFQVNYADIVDMRGDDGMVGTGDDLSYDKASCDGWAGANRFVNTVPVGPGIGGIWAMWHQPWIDPYQWHQPFDGEPGAKEFFPYEDAFTLPSQLPFDVGDLPRSPPGGKPLPPSLPVEVNLFDWFTMFFAERSTLAAYEVQHEGTGGFVTMPPAGELIPVTIPAGEEVYETVEVPIPDVCPEEGTTLTMNIITSDLESGEPIIWQRGKFINDTQPPIGLSQHVEPTVEGLRFELAVMDATTPPTLANLWFSIDGGETWNNEVMESFGETSSIKNGSRRSFVLDLPARTGSKVDYFYTVQDEVFNLLWYGPGQATAPSPPPCIADGETLCLSNDRFKVKISWQTLQMLSGSGRRRT